MAIEMETITQPPVGYDWEQIGPKGPVGYRKYLPEAGGWIYSILTPNSASGGAREPFFVPDVSAWVNASAAAAPPARKARLAVDPLAKSETST